MEFHLAAVPPAECPWKPHQAGQIQARLDGRQIAEVLVMYRDDLPREVRGRFVEWAETAAAQLETTGDPHQNGWFPSSRGPDWWYMVAGTYDLPEL